MALNKKLARQIHEREKMQRVQELKEIAKRNKIEMANDLMKKEKKWEKKFEETKKEEKSYMKSK